MASAMVSFGMVSIPVKLYSTGEASAQVHFNTLHVKCGSRLKQQYICPKDNEVVPRSDMIKGYEFAKDRYVKLTEEEIKTIYEKPTQTIEITEFVPADRVDPVYFDTAYYLGPDKGGDKAYRLLSQAMKKTGRVALAKYKARGRQYLVMVLPYERGLLLQQLRYADEVRSFSEVPVGDAEVKEQELQLATMLIDQIASDEFKPDAYHDEVKKRVLEIIQQKVDGQEITEAPTEAPKAQVIDLMEALKASLGRRADTDASGRKPARRAPRDAAADKSKASG